MNEKNNLVSLSYDGGEINIAIDTPDGYLFHTMTITELKDLEMSCMVIINQIMDELKWLVI